MFQALAIALIFTNYILVKTLKKHADKNHSYKKMESQLIKLTIVFSFCYFIRSITFWLSRGETFMFDKNDHRIYGIYLYRFIGMPLLELPAILCVVYLNFLNVKEIEDQNREKLLTRESTVRGMNETLIEDVQHSGSFCSEEETVSVETNEDIDKDLN
jgi:hypothetical protein